MAQDTQIQQLVINVLTRAQYDALSSVDPNQLYYITDDETFAKIDDTTTSLVKTWSSNKINGLVSGLASILADLEDVLDLDAVDEAQVPL